MRDAAREDLSGNSAGIITNNMNTLTESEANTVVGGMISGAVPPAGYRIPETIIELWNRWLYRELFGAGGE